MRGHSSEQYKSIRVSLEGDSSVSPEGYSRIPASVWKDARLRRSDLHVYCVLSAGVWEGRTTSVGLRRIAEEARLTPRLAHDAVKRLAAFGHIVVTVEEKRRAIYTLTSSVFGQKQGKVDVIVSNPKNGNKRLASVSKTEYKAC